jgi:small subunit ribosomal protein S3
MGKKISPLAYREVCRNIWYISNGAEKCRAIEEDYMIDRYFAKELGGLLCSYLYISRVMKKITVTIKTISVGAVIGKGNERLDKMRAKISALIGKPVIINVEELHKPELSASYIANSISKILVERGNYKFFVKKFISRALVAGAKGILVKIKGRLNGSTIARTETLIMGSLSRQTKDVKIDVCSAPALTISGYCGVYVEVQS